MIDSEVLRLRRLREVALWTRAVARSLDQSRGRTSVFSRSARSGWTIARVITGRLRAHPYVSYQQDASVVGAVMKGVGAGLTAAMARRRGRALSACLDTMQFMARELDDARAVTWSPDLSDTLGRIQQQVRRLVAELEVGARHEVGLTTATVPGIDDAGVRATATDWPYLAI